MKSKPEKPKQNIPKVEAEEWDLSQGMGIFPDGIPFTQNIGCVGGNSKKEAKRPDKLEN